MSAGSGGAIAFGSGGLIPFSSCWIIARACVRWMNRTHLGGAGEDAVKRAQDAGFGNISIDLIYGSRFQDRRSWIKTLERAIGLGVPHISSYHLTIEDKTRLGWLVRHGREPAPDDDKGRDLLPVLLALAVWGNRWLAPQGAPLVIVDARTGEPIDPVLCDARTQRRLVIGEVAIAPGPGASPELRRALARPAVFGGEA